MKEERPTVVDVSPKGVYNRISEMLENHYSCSKELIKSTATFADLGMDSLDAIELTMDLEEYYGVELNDEQVESCKTLEELASFISKEIVSDISSVWHTNKPSELEA